MGSERSLPCSQEPTTSPYPEPEAASKQVGANASQSTAN